MDPSSIPSPSPRPASETTDKPSFEEARTQAVLNSVSSGIVTLNEEGAIDSVNPSAVRMFDYREAELLGQHIRLLIPALGRRAQETAPVIGERPPASRAPEEGQSEVIGIRRDGLAFPISLHLRRIQAGDRQLLMGVIEDLSAQRLLEQSILQASTQEQQRIGRDLHDGLGQELTGIAFLCQTLAQNLEPLDAHHAASARRIVELIGKAIDHTRAVVRGLCPINLGTDGLGLHQSLLELTASTEMLFGVQCRYHGDPPVQVHNLTTATHVYYIARESLNNALKHAGAKHLEIRLSQEEEWARLTVRDDGRGRNTRDPSSPGRGMSIMESRVRMIRGLMNFVDGGHAGSLLTVNFPLPPAPPAGTGAFSQETEP